METGSKFLRACADWFLRTELGHATALVLVLFYVLVWWRILARVGYPGGLAVLMLIPPFPLAVWACLAFGPWPVRRELAALRKVQRVVHAAERRRLVG
jgi:hypothetical protein